VDEEQHHGGGATDDENRPRQQALHSRTLRERLFRLL